MHFARATNQGSVISPGGIMGCRYGALWLIVLFIVIVDRTSGYGGPRTRTRFGQIEGKWTFTVRKRIVQSYLGVPYAQPPIGDLRFRAPLPWNRTWQDPYMAIKDGPACVQIVSGTTEIHGNEDCLYLNIFVPEVSGNQIRIDKLPVMVFVHGGAFNVGSSSSDRYAPDYLLDQDVILITINYRLNILGFFSTATKASPGNYGLKDIFQALQWVHENIESFGGNPDSVTLLGISAGAAAAHHLGLTPKTEGLLHRYILHSGSATAPWAVHPREAIRQHSLQVAILVDCLTKPANESSREGITEDDDWMLDDMDDVGIVLSDDDEEEMMRCLRSVDAARIAAALNFFYTWRLNPYCTFGPTVEDESEEALITMHPLIRIKKRLFRDIPWITGIVQDEGLIKSLEYIIEWGPESETINNFEFLLPYLLEHNEIVENTTEFATAIENYYFEGNVSRGINCNITKMIGDGIFKWPSYRALKHQSEAMNSSSYFFLFSYEGSFTNKFGVAHSDDINYLFPVYKNILGDRKSPDIGNDVMMINIMTEMWANFATTGVPQAWAVPKWPSYQPNGEYIRLGIGKYPDFDIKKNFLPKRMAFWEQLTANLSMDSIEPDNLMEYSTVQHKPSDATSSCGDTLLTYILLLISVSFLNNSVVGRS